MQASDNTACADVAARHRLEAEARVKAQREHDMKINHLMALQDTDNKKATEQQLEARSRPVRRFLMEHVMPEVTAGEGSSPKPGPILPS